MWIEVVGSLLRDIFEVKSFYHVLTISTGFPFPWKSIWRVKIPSRVVFCVDGNFREDIDVG
jgi:hypothetical protein